MDSKLLRIIVAVVIVVGVVARMGHFVADESDPPTSAISREWIADQISAGPGDSLDALKVTSFRYSADAEIILGVGRDGQPGRAGFDDNLNGIVDDRNEMGAVGSDDVCLAPSDGGYGTMIADPNTIVISRGGFEPCKDDRQADRFQVEGLGWFVP